MKITINENPKLTETEIIINCNKTDEQVLRLISLLKYNDNKLTAFKDGQTFVLEPKNVLYIESVDKKTFMYCENSVYETPLKLYELEERLGSDGFIRAAKASIINLSQVRSLRPDLGARLILTLNNGEKIIASRQYAQAIKLKLGII